MGNMKEISLKECNAVFGGTDEELAEITVTATKKYNNSPSFQDTFWGASAGGGFGFANPATMFAFVGADRGSEMVDTNDDGVPDSPIIEVNAKPMTPQQSAVYDYHRDVAYWTANAIHFGLLARAGASSWTGIVGAASSTSIEAIAENKERMIDNLAHLNYQRDGADGSYDKRVDPGYITGEKTLPR